MERIPHFKDLHKVPLTLRLYKVGDRKYISHEKVGTIFLRNLAGHYTGFHYRTNAIQGAKIVDGYHIPYDFTGQVFTIVMRHPYEKLLSGLIQDIFYSSKQSRVLIENGLGWQHLVEKYPLLVLCDQHHDSYFYNGGLINTIWPTAFIGKYHKQLVEMFVEIFNDHFEDIVTKGTHCLPYYNAVNYYMNANRNIGFNFINLNEIKADYSAPRMRRYTHSNKVFYPIIQGAYGSRYLKPRVRDQFNSLLDSEKKYYDKIRTVLDHV